jgi:segregation and condensation protein B
MEEQNRNKETALGEARRPSSVEEAEAAIEAVLFAMGDSVELGRIAKAIGHDTETTRRILNHMMEKYNTKDRGIHIVELENAYQMCTKQEYYDYLVNIAMQPKKAVLTDVMMETLSIIAYKQPVTKQEIDKIRGVKSDHAVNKLVEYNLVQELGRLDAPGRPIVFGTTEEFLRNFGDQSGQDGGLPRRSGRGNADQAGCLIRQEKKEGRYRYAYYVRTRQVRKRSL